MNLLWNDGSYSDDWPPAQAGPQKWFCTAAPLNPISLNELKMWVMKGRAEAVSPGCGRWAPSSTHEGPSCGERMRVEALTSMFSSLWYPPPLLTHIPGCELLGRTGPRVLSSATFRFDYWTHWTFTRPQNTHFPSAIILFGVEFACVRFLLLQPRASYVGGD